MKIESMIKYRIGEPVFFKTDNDQQEHIVTGYIIRPGAVIYLVSNNGYETRCYDFEITSEKNIAKSLN